MMGEAPLQLFEDIAIDDSHNIQTRIESVDQVLVWTISIYLRPASRIKNIYL